MGLAMAAGMDVPDFRDEAGGPVYAAFCAIRIEGARFEIGAENGRLSIATSLSRVSRTQVLSRHALTIDGLAAGTVEMVSAFVKRTGIGNHSIARVRSAGSGRVTGRIRICRNWPLPFGRAASHDTLASI